MTSCHSFQTRARGAKKKMLEEPISQSASDTRSDSLFRSVSFRLKHYSSVTAERSPGTGKCHPVRDFTQLLCWRFDSLAKFSCS